MLRHHLLLIAAVVVSGADLALADTAAFSLTPGVTATNASWSLGYEFSVSSTVTVTSLGFFAAEGTLSQSHDVGLYDLSGGLLASTTITNADTLDAGFRYGSIAGLVLAPGSYVIAGVTGTDRYTYDPLAFGSAPGITFVASRYVTATSLTFPENTNDTIGYFGPNFKFVNSVASVPEPSSMFALGLGILLCARLRPDVHRS